MKTSNPYQAYHKAKHTVPKTRQVVMLYEGVLRNMQQARKAIEEKNVQERYNKLIRASEIIIGLQVSLDFNSGEESAQALYDFYSSLDAQIMQLHRSQSLALCDRIIEEVRTMLEVWVKIDRGELDAVGEIAAAAAQPTLTPMLSDAGKSDEASENKHQSLSESITFSA